MTHKNNELEVLKKQGKYILSGTEKLVARIIENRDRMAMMELAIGLRDIASNLGTYNINLN